MKKYCLSLILILCLCMSYFLNLPSYSVSAEARKLEIVALGDSITTGYKLDGYDASNVSENTQIQNYVNLVAMDKDANVLNLAHDGDKTQDLLDILNDVDNIEKINKADVILISIGGNELSVMFYWQIH